MPTESSHQQETDWTAIYERLQAGEYEVVAELLNTVYLTNLQASHTQLALAAGAARQICLALTAYQSEIAWYQLAQGNAKLRERILKQHAQSVLMLLNEHTPSGASGLENSNLMMPPDAPYRAEISGGIGRILHELAEGRLWMQTPQAVSPTSDTPFHNDQAEVNEPEKESKLPEIEMVVSSPQSNTANEAPLPVEVERAGTLSDAGSYPNLSAAFEVSQGYLLEEGEAEKSDEGRAPRLTVYCLEPEYSNRLLPYVKFAN